MAGIGFDCGTYNLVCCTRGPDNKFIYDREVNAFIEISLEDNFTYQMMKTCDDPVPLIKRKNKAYGIGEKAVRMAYTISALELKRPMQAGCVNPKEKDAFEVLSIMMHSLLEGNVKEGNDVLYYSVPANALNEETDMDYHSKVLQSIFDVYESEDKLKVKAHPINEGLALVYAELKEKNYTGIGVSCLVPGTKIYTKRGILKIEDVIVGDEVITHKGRWKKVYNVITKNFSGVMTKIQLQGYVNNTESYKFVDNHELYVNRDGVWKWVGCESINVGDIVGEPIINQDRNSTDMVIHTYERITSSKKVNKKQFHVSSNVQRLIGYFLADGSINEAEACFQFDFKTSENQNINDVQKILKENFKKESSITKKDSDCIRIKCYSKSLTTWFKKHCFDEAKNKIYPWSLEKLTKADCINLLAGLIRGDGCCSDNSLEFGNTNTHLILLVKQLFSKLGVPASISYRNPREHLLESENRIIQGKKDEWEVTTGSKSALISLKEIVENINCDNNKFIEKLFIENGFCCSRVQKIDHEEYEGIVYDLQVEDDHSFSGPYLTISNCGAGMVNLCFAMFGAPVFQFALVNSGDWIDKQAAKATGETTTFINQEKMKVNLTKEPENLVERAIQTQYKIMIEKTVAGIKKGLSDIGKKARSDKPIDIVIAGGTSSPTGFDVLFRDIIKQADLPINIGNIVRPSDPLFSVARGCLIAAENSLR